MARTTTLTGVVTLATKRVVLTGQVAIREKINLVLTGTGTAAASDLILALVHEGTLVAMLQPLVDYTTHFGGILNLNTEEIVAVFDSMAANAKVKMSIVVWDTTNSCTLVNDFITVQNNPYDSSMDDPTAVGTIGGVEYAPLENGVSNGDSHNHQNGDGADLSPYLIKRVPEGGFFRQSTDNLDIELRDRISNTWHTLILANGTLGIGPAL
jgi:hypothetical protein